MNTPRPGSAAYIAINGEHSYLALWSAEGYWVTAAPVNGVMHQHRPEVVTDVRPVVVLDLTDPAAAVIALEDAANGQLPTPGNYDERRPVIFDIAHQIREQTRPFAPTEPGSLSARVIDSSGVEWAKSGRGCWFALRGQADCCSWDSLCARGPLEVQS